MYKYLFFNLNSYEKATLEKHSPVYCNYCNVGHFGLGCNVLYGTVIIYMEKPEDNYLPREIKLLVIHCSATRCNVPFTVEQLRQCHLQRGFKDIGYHFYITRDGELHHCRPISEPGAHVRGFNRHSIGICYEGGLDENGCPADTRTQAQRFALLDLLTILRHQYPEAQILGHYQLNASIHKACPCFDCRKEYMDI